MISLKNLSPLWHISAFPTWCPVTCFKSRTQWRFLNSKSHLKGVFYVSSFQNIRNWHIWELNILQGMVLLLKSNISWSTGNMLRKEATSHKMGFIIFFQNSGLGPGTPPNLSWIYFLVGTQKYKGLYYCREMWQRSLLTKFWGRLQKTCTWILSSLSRSLAPNVPLPEVKFSLIFFTNLTNVGCSVSHYKVCLFK